MGTLLTNSFRNKIGLPVAIFLIAIGWMWLAVPAEALQTKNVAVSKVTPVSVVLVVEADLPVDVRVDCGATSGVYTSFKTAAGAIRHEILLDGLSPSSRVYYRVTVTDSADPSASVILPESSFRTELSMGQSFRFAVGGDNRPSSDTTVPPLAWDTITGQMWAETPDLVLNVGDIIYGLPTDTQQRNEAKYVGFFGAAEKVTVSAPMYTVVGNHEYINAANNRAGYEQEFTLPVNNGVDAATDGEEYYSFDYGDTHFVALCTEIPGQEGLITGNQKQWLQQDLAATNRRWKVVWMHRPLFAGTHASDPWVNQSNVAGQLNKAEIQALFSQAGVSIVFEGHEHFYHHHLEGGVNYVITGGGGAPLYSAPPMAPGDIFTASTFEHVRVDETSSTLKSTAVDTAGSTLESFTLGAPALTITNHDVYWYSYSDYLDRDLTVVYNLTNGGGDAIKLQVYCLTNTNGVKTLTATPLSLGGLAAGQNVSYNIHYLVPAGVSIFYARMSAVCNDPSGGIYSFPNPA